MNQKLDLKLDKEVFEPLDEEEERVLRSCLTDGDKIHAWYADGYAVDGVEESSTDYLDFGWWFPVDESEHGRVSKVEAKPKEGTNVDPEDDKFFKEIETADGYIKGWYVDGFILGDIIEVDDEVLNFEYWIAVDESTLREVQDTVTFTEEDADVVRNWILHLAVHGYFVNWGESDRKTYEKLTGESVPSLTYEEENE